MPPSQDGPCPDCNGTRWRLREVDGVRRAERCHCWHDAHARDMLVHARIPGRYTKCGFDTFLRYPNEQLERAVARAEAFAEAFPAVDRGLLFIGSPGIGKTHLAVSVLRVVVRKGLRGIYHDTRSLLAEVRASFDPVTRTSQAAILGEVMEADLLVLDDLGAERATEWVEETLNLIVNTRYNQKRPTVFATNYEDVPDSDDINVLRTRVGFRMHSRLREMCEFLEFDGPDYRNFEHRPTAHDLARRWKHRPRHRLPAQAGTVAKARAGGYGGHRKTRSAGKSEQLDLGWGGGRAGNG